MLEACVHNGHGTPQTFFKGIAKNFRGGGGGLKKRPKRYDFTISTIKHTI